MPVQVVIAVPAQMDRIIAGIEPTTIERNFAKWDISGRDVYAISFIGQNYREETQYLKNWLAERMKWMDAELIREFGACPAS